MRKPLFVLLTILTSCACTAFAQGNPSSSASPASPSVQAGSQASTGTAAGEQTMEGCIVREATTYYIQPVNGPRQKLSESQDVAKNEGNHVVVHGTAQSSSASSAGNPASAPAASGQPSASSGDQAFNVTRVDTIATNCPDSMKGKSNPPE